MNDCSTRKPLPGKKDLLAILAVSLIGLLLRRYQLGTDGFWFDEIGVAMAIRSPNVATLVESIRAHVMAMPLDYFVGWLLTRSCQSEACLRLPAALWGAFAIPVSYLLFKHLVDQRTALLGALLLALSPLHIQYSQELRFYASLGFFYILSTLLLLRALEQPTLRRWLVSTLVMIVGSYFHIYVYLALVNGGAWLFFSGKQVPEKKKSLVGLLGSLMIASSFILPGYLYFRSAGNFGFFSFPEAVINLMIGFGWLPAILFPLQPGFVWFPLFLFFQLIGCWSLFNQRNRMMLVWGLSSLLQVGIIFSINIITHYALRGRQILIIMPVLCLIVAEGILKVYKKGSRIINPDGSLSTGIQNNLTRYIYLFSAVCMGIAISILSLQSYYHMEKSRRREISIALSQRWQPGQAIWTTPAWEEKFYGYYLNLLGYSPIQKALAGVEDIQITDPSGLPVCWITNQSVLPDQRESLIKAGFTIVPVQAESVPDTQILWCR